MYIDWRWNDWEAREQRKLDLKIINGIDSARAVPLVVFESPGFGPPPMLPTNLSVRTAR